MATLPSKHSTYVHRLGSTMYLMNSEQDELAMVQDNVSSPIIGEMRMQFWRDAVKSLADVRCPLILYPLFVNVT
jgi:NADH dehydrogenase [ubiquinone] 1 alpha subcomplex assembly factor 6